MKMILILDGLDCANCAEKIRSRVEKLEEVNSAAMNFMAKKLTVDYSGSERKIRSEAEKIIKEIEPDVKILQSEDERSERGVGDIVRIITGAVIFAASALVQEGSWLQFIMLLLGYLIVGGDVLWKAIRNIFRGRVFDENFLMAIATVGAFAIQKYSEAVAVMLFYQVGELFQSYAVNRSRKSIADLMDIRPDYANLKTGGAIKRISPLEAKPGDIIVVQPGERIPLDGTVTSGTSSIDASALTGESVPVTAREGDDVLSGSINQNGVLEVRVSKPYGESTVSKILDLVENASGKKAETEHFITRFAKWYTPAVVISALLLAVIPPVFFGQEFSMWLYRALVFLVISCPCALVISIPLSFFGGIGGASKCGILVKGSNYLELLSQCKTVVFDKTGTLTEGNFEVEEIHSEGISSEEFLRYCAAAENSSSHPIALSVKRAYGEKIPYEAIAKTVEISGKGICAEFEKKIILAGNSKLMEHYGIVPAETDGRTSVHLAVNGVYAGYLTIADRIKQDAARAVSDLKANGVVRTVMLTGDVKSVADDVGAKVGIDEVHAELLPGDKVRRVEELLAKEEKGGKLAFVGDGINDAPVLARADIGIAMGGVGSDAAIEAADIVLMTDEPARIATAMKISRKTMRIVKQNIIFALGIKAIVLILGAFGIASMWLAVFADVGVALIAILNAIRCLNVKSFME